MMTPRVGGRQIYFLLSLRAHLTASLSTCSHCLMQRHLNGPYCMSSVWQSSSNRCTRHPRTTGRSNKPSLQLQRLHTTQPYTPLTRLAFATDRVQAHLAATLSAASALFSSHV